MFKNNISDSLEQVYILEGPNGLFKIGKSVNPQQRLAALKHALPGISILRCIETNNASILEQQLHSRFASRRITKFPGSSELFILQAEDVKYLETVPSPMITKQHATQTANSPKSPHVMVPVDRVAYLELKSFCKINHFKLPDMLESSINFFLKHCGEKQNLQVGK
ncbi:MAG: GIY-YIG nuclease family protein [Negativicutes bacterium]|nr:GIY-YIG nuclease family protein [Negativicutes bacterium]